MQGRNNEVAIERLVNMQPPFNEPSTSSPALASSSPPRMTPATHATAARPTPSSPTSSRRVMALPPPPKSLADVRSTVASASASASATRSMTTRAEDERAARSSARCRR